MVSPAARYGNWPAGRRAGRWHPSEYNVSLAEPWVLKRGAGFLMRWQRMTLRCVGSGVLGWGLCACGAAAQVSPPGPSPTNMLATDRQEKRSQDRQAAIFLDVAAATGLDFVHNNGMSGELYFLEMMGAGAGLLDYDGDGDLDAYLVQGHHLEPGYRPGPEEALGRLFRNELRVGADGTPVLRFTDVTEAAGLVANGYGMGVATGDYDRDGHVDLYLANFGANQLWRNRGDGTFEDVTGSAGVNDPRWSVGASFVDYDRDGWLDLAVVNYNRYSLESDHACHSAATGRQDYCTPTAYPTDPSTLFRNRGDGTFEDVSMPSGFATKQGPGLGIVASDFNLDGWPDILVANDGEPNLLWINQAGQRFVEEGLSRGVAVNRHGVPEANMGVTVADLDQDCDEDVFITHYRDQMNTLWLGDGHGLYEDRTPESGLGFVSLPFNGFGVGDLDYDNDGRLDLYIANGDVTIVAEQFAAGDPHPLKNTDLLFRGGQGEKFEDVTAHAGPAFQIPAVGRGASVGDVDNDGDPDILATYNHGPARLLLNQVGQDASWLGLRLVAGEPPVDSLGAQVMVTLADGRRVCRRARTDGSYASAQDPRVLIGLGRDGPPREVAVTWPDGLRESFDGLMPEQYHTLRKGTGNKVP